MPRELSALGALRQVSLKINRLKGQPLPPEWSTLKHLKMVEIANNELDGELPSDMGRFPGLQYLYLMNNYLQGRLPSTLGSIQFM